MGFGYNSSLAEFGERLEMFDFFSWMKKLQTIGVKEWVVWDASSYFIVNRIPAQQMIKLGSKPSAQQVLDVLIEEQDSPKRAEVKSNFDLRSLYLQRLIELSGVDARYLDSRRVFREDSAYAEALDLSLKFVQRLERDSPDLVAKIKPIKENPGSKLYLPLEIAEAFYLNLEYGVEGKYGPQTEQYFDQAILKLETEWDVPYLTVRSALGPRKPGYLDDQNVLTTKMSEKEVKRLLAFDKEYNQWIGTVTSFYSKESENITDTSLRLLRMLKLGELQ